VAIALGIAWGGGLVLGVLLGSIRPLWPLLGLARSAYAVPIVIIYPIMTVWFGFGPMSKVIFGAFAGLIPMLLMSASAATTVDPRVTLLFHSLGSSRITAMRKGIIPAILPGIVGALRLSGSLCFVSVIVGEMLVSTRGLGYFIAESANNYNTPAVYLGICCVITLAILLHALIGLIQKSSLRYGMR
jgi:NitT/TauT family transport system permease protein